MHSRRSALRLAGLALAGLAGCTGTPAEFAGGPSDRGDQGWTPTESPTAFGGTRTPTPGPVTATPTSDRLRWRYRTGGRMTADTAPLLGDGVVYAASRDLHAVANGTRQWRLETDGERTHRPVEVEDRLYVVASGPAGSDATLHAVSTVGRIQWTVSITENAGGPMVMGATPRGVYVAGFEAPADTVTPGGTPTTADSYRPTARYVVALDADGSERWRREIGDVSGEWRGALQGGVLYVHPPQTTAHYAFDAESGDVRWRFHETRYGPVVTPEGVFVIDTGGALRRFALDGTQQWRFALRQGSPDSLAVDGARSYLTRVSGSDDPDGSSIPATLFAIDPGGRERWRFDSAGGRFGRPVPRGERVYAGSFDGRVYAVDDATGGERWTFPTDGERTVSPVVATDAVYAYELAHDDLYAIDAGSGNGRWRFSPGALLSVDDGVVYVGAENGTLYALSA